MFFHKIAETKDVWFSPSEVQLRDGKPELKIGGLIFHSAIVAENIRVVQHGSTVRILIDMALTRPGKSGRFEVTVPLSDSVERVIFGSAGNEVWRDESGGTVRSGPVL